MIFVSKKNIFLSILTNVTLKKTIFNALSSIIFSNGNNRKIYFSIIRSKRRFNNLEFLQQIFKIFDQMGLRSLDHSPNNTESKPQSHLQSSTLHYIILTPLKLARSISHVNLVQRQTCQIGVLVKREKKRKKGRERGREEKQCRHDTTRRVKERWILFECFTTSVSSSFSDPSIRGKLHWNDPPSSRIIASYSRSFEPVETTTFVRLSDDRLRQSYVIIMLPSRVRSEI